MLNKTLVPLFGSVILTAGLHFWFLANDFYYIYLWVDIPVHFLGGVVIASIYIWLSSFVHSIPKPTWSRMLVVILVVGMGWELWEVFVGAADMSKLDYAPDTIQDMVNDTLGALGMWWLYAKLNYKHNSEIECQK